jgi:mannosyltransferase OCH1-like enzyme
VIPSIVHQTAPSKLLTPEERRLLRSNHRLLPGWRFELYDDLDNDRLFTVVFPEFLDAYRSIRKGVIKADIMRCVYLYKYGGWYLDTDYLVLKPLTGRVSGRFVEYQSSVFIDAELSDQELILPVSGVEGVDQHLVCNSIMASVPGHPFWRDFVSHLFQTVTLSQLDESSIESETGPLGLSRFLLSHEKQFYRAFLPEKSIFHPQITAFGFAADLTHATYGIHWCWGSWRTKNLMRRLKNISTRKITSRRYTSAF